MTITQEELKKLLHYEPETGVFTWLHREGHNGGMKSGRIAGYKAKICGKTYEYIMINYKNISSHRLAWLYMTGKFPDVHIDHIDGNGANNKWINLRSVNRGENQRNMRRFASNKSGITGVYFRRDTSSWCVQITFNKNRINIGSFSNIFDAACARKNAEVKYGFHKNHGSDRPL